MPSGEPGRPGSGGEPRGDPVPPTPYGAVRVTLAFAGLLAVAGALVFLPAGRVDWIAGWVWVATVAVSLLVVRALVVRAHPALPARRRRAGEGTPTWDVVALAGFQLSMVAVLVIAGLDAGRYGWSSVPVPAAAVGDALVALGLGIFGAAAVHNPYFESTVRIQSEEGHTVASSGPYRVVRHPGYVGLMVLMLGSALALRSAWALLPVAAGWVSLSARTALEDRFLHRRLAGYADYAGRVRYRLVPGVW